MTSAIVLHGLTKDYGSGHGLFELDLEVSEGEVFGFLGPNGAGKTTTIRLLMGVIHATSGTATVFGLDCDRELGGGETRGRISPRRVAAVRRDAR